MNIVLIDGFIRGNAANKWDFIYSLGHEYKHILDNIKKHTLLKFGFEKSRIQDRGVDASEIRVINYQRSLDLWEFTSENFKKVIKDYENQHSK